MEKTVKEKFFNVLIIDDSEADRSTLKQFLSEGVNDKARTYAIREADTLEESLAYFQNGSLPDCILLDSLLPDTDGISALKYLLQQYGPTLCIILLTEVSDDNLVAKAFKNGAFDCLQKDRFDARSLQYAVSRAIRKAQLRRSLYEEQESLRKSNIELREEKQALEERQRELIRMQLETSIAMVDIQKENERKTQELEAARQLQLSMLPYKAPNLPYLQMGMRMRTCVEVGGDYYDYKLGSDNSLLTVIGDATGHGVRAGIVVATVKSYFHTVDAGASPAELLEDVSDGIRNLQVRNMYMGLCAMRFYPGSVHMASAGMPPVYIYRQAEKRIEEIKLIGPFLGFNLPVRIQEKKLKMAPGDVLLTFSDGLPELFNERREQLGYDAIIETFLKNAELPVASILDALETMCDEWRAGAPISDDIALLVVRMKKDA